MPLGIHRTNNGGRNVPIRILTLKDRLPLDSLNVELADLSVGHRVNVALDVLVG